MSSPRGTVSGPQRRIAPGLMAALGYVSMGMSLSTDLYLPAFPSIAGDFGVPAATVQLTLTAVLIGAAFGQLIIGSISDALGRRPTLIVALVLFTACCYLATASNSIEMLIAVRAVQGFAGAAGSVLARAVVADLTSRAAAVRAFSTLFVFVALGPAVASPLGAALTQWGGWRAALLGLAVIATGMLVVTVLFIPESLPRDQRQPFVVSVLLRNIGGLLRTPPFVAYALAFATGYAALITYLGSSSFIVQDVFGLSPLGYAVTFSTTAVSIMAGSWASGRLGVRIGAAPTLRWALVLALLSAGTLALLAATGELTLVTYLPLVVAFAIGSGAMLGTASGLAVGQASRTAGAGSAVVGFTQSAFGAVASPLGGLWGTETAVPATVVMTVFALAGLICASTGARLAPAGSD
ncbi:multidrug effflux MFS transporter [Microbacterium sp.]|uniref:multidrug effflux MFS transporter n=1 Tax=Microbacterium sp. TaxID=51671 RepID=UPI003A85895C